MRVIGLILLWLGVVGFGLFTLCSGALSVIGDSQFILFAVLGAGMTAGCFAWARSMSAKSLAKDQAQPQDTDHGAQP
jgi:hypothetical protein